MVELVESAADSRRSIVSEARERGKRIGLVPTMGALHEGHVQLIRQCRAETEFVVVSIFVNPTQFGAGEDFGRYPRPLEDDLRQCESRRGRPGLRPQRRRRFTPMARRRPSSRCPALRRPRRGQPARSFSRRRHGRAQAFRVVRPDLAVFGQKDYQQQLVIRRMVEDLHVPVRLSTCPTVREADGLALSSRNRYLNPQERQAAAVLYRALERAEQAVAARRTPGRPGSTDSPRNTRIRAVGQARLCRSRRCRNTGAPWAIWVMSDGPCALVAARVGTTRLIDNALLIE